jgi:tetratricopeptide (TPR) repeat protein
MRRRIWAARALAVSLSASLVLGLGLGETVAVAVPVPAPGKEKAPAQAPAQATSKGASKAQELMHSGMAHRRAGELDQAVADFTEAYRLSPEPNYLYLLGEAQREAGRTQEALAAYRRYLEVAPSAPDRRLVQDEIDTLSQQPMVPPSEVRPPRGGDGGGARREEALPAPPGQRQPQLQLQAAAQAPRAERGASRRLVWLWASLGVVAAAGAAVGLVLGLRPTEPTFVTGPGALP